MDPQWTRALPGALIVMILASACQDAPLAPRAPATRADQPRDGLRQMVFSGRSSDSLVEHVMLQWARRGHPEYGRAIDAWRRRELGTTRPGLLPAAPDPGAAPSRLITGDAETIKAPPNVLTHREALHFGWSGGGSSIPTIVEGEMTFVGDVGRITLTALTITSKTGVSYVNGGDLAQGPGQLINCADVTLSSCSSSRRLAGSVSLGTVPNCDASAYGSLQYTAQNVQATYATSTVPTYPVNTGGDNTDTFSASAALQATANPCPVNTDTTNASSTTGSGSDPGDQYPTNEPWPAPGPPPYEGEPWVPTYECETYVVPGLIAVVMVCSET
jgi:hypothetical protein